MILAGRALPDETPEGQDLPSGRCIGCGKTVKHINDDGNAWLARDDKGNEYLYCNAVECSRGVWECCEMDQVGGACCACKEPLGLFVPNPPLVPGRRE